LWWDGDGDCDGDGDLSFSLSLLLCPTLRYSYTGNCTITCETPKKLACRPVSTRSRVSGSDNWISGAGDRGKGRLSVGGVGGAGSGGTGGSGVTVVLQWCYSGVTVVLQ
jgi:hypothetical protein